MPGLAACRRDRLDRKRRGLGERAISPRHAAFIRPSLRYSDARIILKRL